VGEAEVRQGRNASRIVVVLSCVVALQGCLSEDEETAAAAAGKHAGLHPEVVADLDLSGSVGDGPIVGATLTVYSKTGEVLDNAVSSEQAGYNIQLKTKGKNYPLTIEVLGGIDLVTNRAPDFVMYSAVSEPRGKAVANVSPFSTLAVAAARQMSGGLTTGNLAAALEAVLIEFNCGLTSSMARDPITTPVNETNFAGIVKASEMLAEILRRTHATVRGSAPQTSVDDIVQALAADLVDGVLDGRGAANADRQISAAAVLVSSQIMIEAMTNELRVDGRIVTPVLDDVIERLSGGRAAEYTESQPVTVQMLDRARNGVAAALEIAASAALEDVAIVLSALRPGATASLARQMLPADASATLNNAIAEIALGAAAGIDAVIPPTEPALPANAAPTISGAPALSVVQNAAYRFAPQANDADGDVLHFTVANKPIWASFNATTGALTGTPSAADIGSYGGITIRVSDGELSAQLPAFSIVVEATALGSATLSWTPPTQNVDGSPLLDLAGYRVYWGSSSSTYTSSVEIANSGVTAYVVENLSSGTHFFAVTALSSRGTESSFSNEAMKTVR
jgi:hypothetical protein